MYLELRCLQFYCANNSTPFKATRLITLWTVAKVTLLNSRHFYSSNNIENRKKH